MTTTDAAIPTSGTLRGRRTGRWIDDWTPEDPDFWTAGGRIVARRNLICSIFAEHLGFSVWLLWSVSAALLAKAGFAFTPPQLFVLVAVPNLVGSLLRLPYTFAVPKFGGRNWTVFSAFVLLVPTGLFAYFVQRSDTPYWVFLLIAATAGVGGGNFSSSMTNINFFYPARLKGSALGLNAAGGNLGVSLAQFFVPIIVGAGGAFGLIKVGETIHLELAGYLYGGLAIVAGLAAWTFMNNLSAAYSKPRELLSVGKYKHTWIMALLYIGTFGSFIGYSAALPLLIKINFFRAPTPVDSIGINFVYYAFLGALVGSFTRPFGGWLADRVGGAKVTMGCFLAMIVGTLGVFFTLRLLQPVPVAPSLTPAVVEAVNHNSGIFPWFLGAFLFVFAATGVANGSTYRMIPHIFRAQAHGLTAEGTVERYAAEANATKISSAALGVVGAVGALGGFLIPITFGSPWVTDPVANCKTAFLIFTAFYALCLTVTYVAYVSKRSAMGRAGV